MVRVAARIRVEFWPVFSFVFIVILIVAVFAIDIGKRWWQENEWRRRWKGRRPDDE